VVALFENFAVPFQIGGHSGSAGAARDEFERRVYIAHLPRGIGSPFTVFRGRHVADLPGAIHLVAKTPVRSLVGIGDAVLPPKVTPLRALLYVAILHE